MTRRLLTLVAPLILMPFLFSCTSATNGEDGILKIATWNLEWFGALGRDDTDIDKIADIVTELQLDLISLQEITCECTLSTLAEKLNFNYYISSQRVPQKLAVLWNPATVETVNFNSESYNALRKVAAHGLGRESRQPLVFNVVSGKFDFTFVVVHLKSIPEDEYSLRVRNIQYDSINEWLKSKLENPEADKDIIIAGDFNAYNTGVSSERLLETGYVEFTTAGFGSKEYSSIWHDRDGNRNLSLIDHIAITSVLKHGEFREILPIRDWDTEMADGEYERRISDHLPLVAVFSNTTDDD